MSVLIFLYKMLLERINKHPRDDNITFKEENHEYTITGLDRKPTSVTTLIHHYFPEFDPDSVIKKMMSSRNWTQSKYYGRTVESIKEEWRLNGENASGLGTIMHRSIEQFLNDEPPDSPDTKEFGMFLQFWNNLLSTYPTLRPYRTEWLVYDETIGLAGSIDCVLTDDNGNVVIIDWKRSKEIKTSNRYEKGKWPFDQFEHCNYSHYRLQLNFYRHMLENIYNKNVIYMMLVILHPDQDNYQCFPVDRIELSSIWNRLT